MKVTPPARPSFARGDVILPITNVVLAALNPISENALV